MSQTEQWCADKVFVVTGSTQGIGAEVAFALARAGARGLVICGRNTARGTAVAAALEDAGAAAKYVAADLADEAACRAVIAACDTRFGRLDGLVNAAGVTDRGTIENTTVDLWDRMFAVNTRAPFILMQDSIAMMKRERIAGGIVNIITMSSHGGQPFLTAYAASKGALATLTKNVAHAVRADRIRVNGVNIGWTDTPNEHQVQMSDGNPADWLATAEAAQPFGRLIKPEDAAHICLFLLSPRSGVMTGALIDCDQNVMGAYD